MSEAENSILCSIFCHCCGAAIYGCMGFTSWPGGDIRPENTRFHCGICTLRLSVCHLTGSECEQMPDEDGYRVAVAAFNLEMAL